jgi:hypothetical protein
MFAEQLTVDIGENIVTVLLAITNLLTLLFAGAAVSRTKQLKPNGGSSVADKVDAIYSKYVAQRREEDGND